MILEVENISKSYGKLKVLDGVSFNISEGEYVALIGKNGAGKTTLLNLLLGLANPDSGSIKFFGKTIENNLIYILNKIGIVFQQHTLDFDLSVSKNLKFYADVHGMDNSISLKRIKDLLERFELNKFENYKARNLSGGMKRRLEIARALLKEPKILILDEATSGLDPSTRQQILSDLKNLIKEKKITVLTITHLESEITDVNKIIKLEKGKIV
ncbi:MAG: ABC transporter ATP-binding protein [Pelagibacteraceae bacterium]|nr:ABC transporter ATP-binding protein [Pelagibacteraceae bacterium]|tara:strand:- start:1000 stop:1638 length:639 start_codon:yes stop_codon:yes gene_type:complete